MNTKKPDHLRLDDFLRHPVWELVAETDIVRPVRSLPVRSLNGRIVGVEVRLACGFMRWASLCNISLTNVRATKQFLVLRIEREGRWFSLGRYFDVDYEARNAHMLAAFLGLSIKEVFPIAYDISQYAVGLPDVIRGTLLSEPEERLSVEQQIALSLETAQDAL